MNSSHVLDALALLEEVRQVIALTREVMEPGREHIVFELNAAEEKVERVVDYVAPGHPAVAARRERRDKARMLREGVRKGRTIEELAEDAGLSEETVRHMVRLRERE